MKFSYLIVFLILAILGLSLLSPIQASATMPPRNGDKCDVDLPPPVVIQAPGADVSQQFRVFSGMWESDAWWANDVPYCGSALLVREIKTDGSVSVMHLGRFRGNPYSRLYTGKISPDGVLEFGDKDFVYSFKFNAANGTLEGKLFSVFRDAGGWRTTTMKRLGQ